MKCYIIAKQYKVVGIKEKAFFSCHEIKNIFVRLNIKYVGSESSIENIVFEN